MRHRHIQDIVHQVKASYASIASEFDQTRKQAWPEFETFLNYVKPGAKVLDLGCGNGRLYDSLQDKKVNYVGVDHNSSLLEKAQQNFPEAEFRLGDMVDLNLVGQAFDNVFCIASFHHIPTRKMRVKVLQDIHSYLKNDGVLILTTWNLFQPKYLGPLLKAFFRALLTLGQKGSWNDVWIKWGRYPLKRYYHSFLPKELKGLFDPSQWKMEAFYFTKKGKVVSFKRSFNIIVIARKISRD